MAQAELECAAFLWQLFAKHISLRNFMHVAEANMLEKVTLVEMIEGAVSLDNSEICLTQPQLF